MKRIKLCSIILFLVALSLASTIKREGYGTSKTGLWSQLTPFEEFSIGQATNAQKGDGDALLALALIGSGDVRTMDEYKRIRARVKKFNKSIAPLLAKKKTQREQAELIYDKMLETFFEYDRDRKRLRGYEFNQSKLSDIFATKKYNCVSSALLYIILLSYADIPSEGVIVPSHVFVQITTDKGEIIEVETTSKDGFDFEHTKESVEDKSRGWYVRRGLEYYNWEGYLNRKFSSPFFTVMRNYNNQHTASDKMKFVDQMRLAEIAHRVYEKSSTALQRRISYYLNESNMVNEDTTGEVSSAFYKTITPLLDTVNLSTLEDTVQLYVQLLQLNQIIGTLPHISSEKSIAAFLSFLSSLPSSYHSNHAIYQNALFVTNRLSNALQKAQKKEVLNTFLTDLKPLYPALSEKSGDLEQLQYAMQIRNIMQTLQTTGLADAIKEYNTFLQELPKSTKADKLIQNNTTYLLEQLMSQSLKERNAETITALLSMTSVHFGALQRDVDRYRSYIPSFKLDFIIKKAKAGKLVDAKKELLQLLSQLTEKDKTDKTIQQNLTYLLYYFTVHDSLESSPSIKEVLSKTATTIPTMQKSIATIELSVSHNALLALIERIPEQRAPLIQDMEIFIKELPQSTRKNKKIRNNLTYLFQKLYVTGDTTGLGGIEKVLCTYIPEECDDIRSFAKRQNQGGQSIKEIDALIDKKSITEAFNRYKTFYTAITPEKLTDATFVQNLSYISEKLAVSFYNSKDDRILELFTLIKQSNSTLYGQLLPIKAQFHFQKGNQYWNRKEWEAAATEFTTALPHTTNKQNRKALLKNLDGAYFNWAIDFLNSGNKEKAKEILEKSLSLYPKGEHCNKLKEQLKK